MFNNSENRFSKYSCEMAENRKKRKLSGVHQQYPFPYEEEKVGKENFSQVSNSHHVSLNYYSYAQCIYILKLY